MAIAHIFNILRCRYIPLNTTLVIWNLIITSCRLCTQIKHLSSDILNNIIPVKVQVILFSYTCTNMTIWYGPLY